ncbi:uncharacterized protein N7498_007235 [Penicillium cinerascens]|uniref:Muramidase n=1 Tax=Penicillium cinerascens TaxID=70096 RepID=A0A9W9JJJ7_9EURO|nr:uncharacterized protein N7498_007235 [Penicillium cinerascens]KAJ5198118.1 hypothetical protein N7498_007235 [Penicillium cinerascens]
MLARRFLLPPLQLRLSTLYSVTRLPANTVGPLYCGRPNLQPFRKAIPFSATVSSASPPRSRLPPDDDEEFWGVRRPSKRKPTIETTSNEADNLERLLQADGFKTWGFIIYRCTYQSNADWEKFMTLLLDQTTRSLKCYNGLDLLDSLAPTVMEDSSFEGAATATLRGYFNKWATTAKHLEQGVPLDQKHYAQSGPYRYFLMVDQEALESVLNEPNLKFSKSAFVRLVDGQWEPEVLDEEELEALGGPPEEFEPLEGCTLEDVGWMKIPFGDSEFTGFVWFQCNTNGWDMFYLRPPEMHPPTRF